MPQLPNTISLSIAFKVSGALAFDNIVRLTILTTLYKCLYISCIDNQNLVLIEEKFAKLIDLTCQCFISAGQTSIPEVTTISQAHFTPLAEALHRCVDELNSMQQEATFEAIGRQLNFEFPSVELPSEDILNNSLNSLVAENKLSFDHQRQVYTAMRILLSPWDEFENLTLSDNFKPDKEEDEIELEFKNINSENLNKCANFDQIYLKSNTLSTENSSIDDCKEEHFLESTKLLRRNSSLSNEIDQTSVSSEPRRGNFKRSKSLKMSYKPSSDVNGSLLTKDCTCNEIIIKSNIRFGHVMSF